MSTDSADDLGLARRAGAGDESASAALYDRYADLLFAFIHHRLDESPRDVEEVWQETWLAAIRSLPGYRGESRLFTWLAAIARNKIADHCRRRGCRRIELLSDVSPARLAALMDKGPLPEDVVQRRATRAYVVQAMAALPEECRTALVARYADERSVGEVARLLGRSYKATESLLSRARTAFRVALAHVTEE